MFQRDQRQRFIVPGAVGKRIAGESIAVQHEGAFAARGPQLFEMSRQRRRINHAATGGGRTRMLSDAHGRNIGGEIRQQQISAASSAVPRAILRRCQCRMRGRRFRLRRRRFLRRRQFHQPRPIPKPTINGGNILLPQLIGIAAAEHERAQISRRDAAAASHRAPGKFARFSQLKQLMQLSPRPRLRAPVQLAIQQQSQPDKGDGAMQTLSGQFAAAPLAPPPFQHLRPGHRVRCARFPVKMPRQLRRPPRLRPGNHRLVQIVPRQLRQGPQQCGPQGLGNLKARLSRHRRPIQIPQNIKQPLPQQTPIPQRQALSPSPRRPRRIPRQREMPERSRLPPRQPPRRQAQRRKRGHRSAPARSDCLSIVLHTLNCRRLSRLCVA